MNSFTLSVQQPFDWESLLAFLRLRATPGVEVVTDSAYTRTITDGAAAQTLSVTYDSKSATLQVGYSGKTTTRSLVESRVRQMFKPDVNTAPIEAFLCRDPWLAGFVKHQAGLRVPGGWSALEIAMRAILGQQVSVPAATTLMGRLVRAAGTRLDESSWLFPTRGTNSAIESRRTGSSRQPNGNRENPGCIFCGTRRDNVLNMQTSKIVCWR